MGHRLAAVVMLAGLAVGPALAGCRDMGVGVSGDSSAAPGAGGASAEAVLVVPDVTGQRWSDVRHKLLALGFDDLNLHDGTGKDRPVIVAENWIVRSQVPAAGTRGTAKTRITLTVTKPTDGAGSARTTDGVVPDVVCKDLQHAQDALQAAGFDNLDSTDGTGRDRMQIIDRNWVVIAQSARAGSRPAADTRIVLTAVKFGEPTGSSGCPS